MAATRERAEGLIIVSTRLLLPQPAKDPSVCCENRIIMAAMVGLGD